MSKITKISKLFLCTNLIFGVMAIFSVTSAMKSQALRINEKCTGYTELAQKVTWTKKEISGVQNFLNYEEYTSSSSPKVTVQCANSSISETEKQQVLSCLEKNFIGSNKLERVYRLVKVEPNVTTYEGRSVTKTAGEFSGLMVIRGGVLWIETAGNGNKYGTLVELPPTDTFLSTSPFFVRTVGCASLPRRLDINLPVIITAHDAPGAKVSSCAVAVDCLKKPIGANASNTVHCERTAIPRCRGAQWCGLILDT